MPKIVKIAVVGAFLMMLCAPVRAASFRIGTVRAELEERYQEGSYGGQCGYFASGWARFRWHDIPSGGTSLDAKKLTLSAIGTETDVTAGDVVVIDNGTFTGHVAIITAAAPDERTGRWYLWLMDSNRADDGIIRYGDEMWADDARIVGFIHRNRQYVP